MKKIRIGGGAGYGGDRIEPAVDLIRFGNLDYIIFECLAERTIALAQQKKKEDSRKGYNELLEHRISKVLPLLKDHKVKIITNMGAANPKAAMEVTGRMAREYGLTDLKIMGVLGDDIIDGIDRYMDFEIAPQQHSRRYSVCQRLHRGRWNSGGTEAGSRHSDFRKSRRSGPHAGSGDIRIRMVHGRL